MLSQTATFRRCVRPLALAFALALVAVAAPRQVLAASASKSPAGDGGRAAVPPEVAFDTSLGTFVVRLFTQEAPLSSQNLLAYVDDKFYDGLIFHRVIPDFMVQGGGFDERLKEKATQRPALRNEATGGRPNRRGTLAMARTADPDSARAQFFVNVVDNPALDARAGSAGYAVVGEVVSGMEVVDKIRAVPTRCASHGAPADCVGLPPGMRDVPATPVVIRAARRVGPTKGR